MGQETSRVVINSSLSDVSHGTQSISDSSKAKGANLRKKRFPYLYKYRYEYREYIAELVACTILLAMGISINATVTFYTTLISEYITILSLGWGFSVVASLYAISGTGGGHLNPSMTIALAVCGLFPWKKVPGFIVCQFLGCFFGSAIAYSLFVKKFNEFDGGSRQTTGPKATAAIFSSYPDPVDITWTAFYIEFCMSFILNFIIQGILENRTYPSKGIEPVVIGILVSAIVFSTAVLGSMNMNPARDLAPRVFTAFFGWGSEPFTANRHYFWVPIVAPIFGAVGGVACYELLMLPADNE
ncbi:Aquaporin-9 [Smittium mucronatum]|uniref:Aquaporin-9 n=1 Tax=Smittium mucronatum TaxID=133383 RepID=A0A1R0H2Y1_9FUNG|nr:Aquaporin-9 [Smittium mucronatum]